MWEHRKRFVRGQRNTTSRRSRTQSHSIFLWGPGVKAIAWAVPSTVGTFALSIRGRTEACAVWARAANPADVEGLFRRILEGASRPGIDVRVFKDTRDQSPSGVVHTLIYSVSGTEKQRGGLMYIMQTAERSGGPFQASLKSARYIGAIDDAVGF